MDRDLMAGKCLRIEKAGGSVLEYLHNCGCISPWGTWYRLKREELGRKSWQITDGKGSAEMQKVTLEQKKKAVEIAIKGGNPLPYLKECGSKKPESLWYIIKQNLKEVDPEKFAKLPDLRLNKKKEEQEMTQEEVIGHMTIEPSETVKQAIAEALKDGAPEVEEPVNVCGNQVGTKPLNYDGFEVTGLKTGYGDFRMSNNGFLFFGTLEKDELEMPVEIWQQFAGDLPKVMAILGISKN